MDDHTHHNLGRMFFNHIQCWRFTIQPCVWQNKGIATSLEEVVLFGATLIKIKELMASYYVDCVSLTHGCAGSRQHIWTFGLSEHLMNALFVSNQCPCDVHDDDLVPHLFKTISFVRVAYTLPGDISIYCTLTMYMFSGMVRTVCPTAHAVSSTILHGLQRI